MQFFKQTNINFVGQRLKFFYTSLVINVFGLILIITGFMGAHFFEPEFGIDFKGGTEVGVSFESKITADLLRKSLDKSLDEEPEIKSFGGDNQFLIRIKATSNGSQTIKDALNKSLPNAKYKILKEDKIGPKIGNEMRNYALVSILFAIGFILLYTAFRFEFTFGVAAIIALIHDVIVTIVFILVFNKTHLLNLEINQGMLAAMLTVIGFSIHDTVIIFDRIRENKEKHKGMPLLELINLSINETLSRTLNTVLTVVLVLATITIMGGPVLEGFGFTMLVGILTGTYSSIYIASSFVIWQHDRNKKASNSLSTAKA